MKRVFFAVLGASLFVAPAAFAKKGAKATPPTHHCMKDGAEQAGMTKKQCAKAGGKWEKMAPGAEAAPAAPAPAPATP